MACMLAMMVGCSPVIDAKVAGPKEVTDSFLGVLFLVEDYDIINAPNLGESVQRSLAKLEPLKGYTDDKVLETLHGDRYLYFMEKEAEHYNGTSKWVPGEMEIRDEKEDSCSVWYSGNMLITGADGVETLLPISGTAYLERSESGWVIKGHKFIVNPIGEVLY